jgi:hypothetical protein
MSPAARARKVRPSALPGGFISEPGAFRDAPAGLEHVIKLMYRPNVRTNGDVGLDFSTDALVVDLSAVDASRIDASKVAADCDFLKGIALAHERELRQIIVELQKGTAAGAARAESVARKIGATEADAVAAGGGFFFLVIIGIGLLAGGCVGGGAKHKATSPAATTTPK